MKRILTWILAAVMLLSLTACGEAVSDLGGEELLRTIVEKIDFDQLQSCAEEGAAAVLEKFPALKTLADREDMQQLLKDKGLGLIREYLESTDADVQENAQKLGAIIKILSPELADEIDDICG